MDIEFLESKTDVQFENGTGMRIKMGLDLHGADAVMDVLLDRGGSFVMTREDFEAFVSAARVLFRQATDLRDAAEAGARGARVA